jgi:hypothetical protein
MSSPVSLSYLNNLIVDPDSAVPVRGTAGRDRLDEDAQLFQPRIRAHPHTCHTRKAVLGIRIRMYLGLPDPDPLGRGKAPALDPDPSLFS